MITAQPPSPRLLIALLCLLSLPGVHAADPPPTRSTAPGQSETTTAAPSSAKSGPADASIQQVQAWLRNTGDTATKLFAATEDLKKRVDDRRVLPGGSPAKKAPFLLTQVDELDKQCLKLQAEITQIEEYKTRNLKTWGENLENQLLEIQISERSSAETLEATRATLHEKRWWLLGH